ncbi:MAG TPA: HAD family phosphatase [Isosphaeraceae bacterium]
MPDAPLLAIFDHDGVLVDSLEHHQHAWLELGRKTGLPITDAFIRETFGTTNPSIFARLLGRELDAETLAKYSDLKEACYREVARGNVVLLPGIKALLDGLTERGVRLAIGSSGVLPNLLLTVESCALEGRFAAIASLEDITRGKPDPEVFQVAAKKAGVEPKHAVVFEDATFGIEAAKAAGMYAVGVTTTNPADVLHGAGADEVVSTFEGYDVAALVDRLRSA